jgi:MFS family permease
VVLFYLPIKDSVLPIYTILFLYSILNQFYLPAEAATLPGVCHKKLLVAANSIFLFTVYGALIVGFGLAGPLIKLVGYQMPFVLGSLMLIFAALSVWLLPERTFSKAKARAKLANSQEFFKKLKEGYQFIQTNPPVLFPLLLLVFCQIIITMLAVLSPAAVVKILGTALINVSETFIIPVGVGAMVGMITTVRLLQKTRKRYLITTGLFLASLVLFCLVLIIPHFAYPAKIVAQISLGFLIGLAFSIFTIPTQTLLQEKTPVGLRGRVFGVLGFLITLSSVVPVLFAATIGEVLGEIWMILILAIIIFILGIISLKGENVVYRFYRT